MGVDVHDERERLLDRIRGTMDDAARREWAEGLTRAADVQVEFQSSVLACVELLSEQVRELVESRSQQHEGRNPIPDAASAQASQLHRLQQDVHDLRQASRQHSPDGHSQLSRQISEVELSVRTQRLEDAERSLRLWHDLEQRVSRISARLDDRLRDLERGGSNRTGLRERSTAVDADGDAPAERAKRRDRRARRRLRKDLRRLESRLAVLEAGRVGAPSSLSATRNGQSAPATPRSPAAAARPAGLGPIDGARSATDGGRADTPREPTHDTPGR